MARYANVAGANPNCALRFDGAGAAVYDCNADLFRDGYTNYNLATHALYVQDTFSVKRFTLNLGVRWDRATDEALPGQVPANPLIPQIMPAIDFPGLDGGVVWNDISPRLGMTYDITGTGKSVARASYSMYFGQMATGPVRRPADLDRPGVCPLPVGGPQRRHVRSGQRAEHRRQPDEERGVRPDEPDELPLAGNDRSEPQERSDA